MSKRRERRAKLLEKAAHFRTHYRGRRFLMLGFFIVAASALILMSVRHQIFEKTFLQHEGERRYLKNVIIPAHRGRILDRNHHVLAASTPVSSLWINPKRLTLDYQQRRTLAKIIHSNSSQLIHHLNRKKKSFVYIAKGLSPEIEQQVREFIKSEKLSYQNIGLEAAYRRYYPDGEVFAHILGFTNIDDQGIEGIEKVQDKLLSGHAGKKQVIKNGRGQIIKNIKVLSPAQQGHDLKLSLDRRLQYLAYQELKRMMKKHRAKAASAVLLDIKTGEILALVNQPSYNPNGLKPKADVRRNRAVTDTFEPGSTFKPLTIAIALETGQYQPYSQINTNPGYYYIGKYKVADHNRLGIIDLTTIIQKSSNVGASKIALSLSDKVLWQYFKHFGVGQIPHSGLLGEAKGRLRDYHRWAKIDQATLSFGYGVAVSTLQLAKAYAIIANNGLDQNYAIYPQTGQASDPTPVLKTKTAKEVRLMMESVVKKGGTAIQAAIEGYRVAGKTGTSKIKTNRGYTARRYYALFSGMAPASNPRFVMTVVVREPSAGQYYGGQVAAPVFSKVMAGALRMYNIKPDKPLNQYLQLAGTIQ